MVRYCYLAILLLAIGCGARSSVELGGGFDSGQSMDSGLDSHAESSTKPVPDEEGEGKCVECDGDYLCGFCKVGGVNVTYRCDIPSPPPKGDCWSLSEQYSKNGKTFTCYYCD